MISNLSSPIYVQVEITSDCNNRCLYCYNFWRYTQNLEKRKSLPIEGWEKIAQILGENNVFYVTVTGGEPFLEKDKMFKFFDFLCRQNIRIMVNSNATLISEEDVKKLSDYPIEIFLVSLISFDEKQHNTIAGSDSAFKMAINGINLLRNQGINLAINTVATKLNYQDIYTTGKWLYDQFGIENFSATPICPSSQDHQWLELNNQEVFAVLNQLICLRNDLGIRVDILEVLPTCLFTDYQTKNIREIVKIFSKRMCTAGNTTVTIGSEGDVRVCSFDKQIYGNLLKEDFKKIWSRMQKWRDNSLLPEGCRNCVIVESCGGGCRVNANIKKGSYCELDSFSRDAIKEEQNTFFNEISDINIDSKFSFIKNVFLRKEKDGIFIAVANSMYFVIVNTKGLEILKYLKGLDTFTPREVIEKFNLNYEVSKKFFAELLNKGFLIDFDQMVKKGGGGKWLWNFQGQP